MQSHIGSLNCPVELGSQGVQSTVGFKQFVQHSQHKEEQTGEEKGYKTNRLEEREKGESR